MAIGLKLFSLNVRGIRTNSTKRKIIFEYFIMKPKCCVFLQETHCTSELENTWKQEWGSDIIFSHGSSNSKGVAILLPKQVNYTILNKNIDPDGRFVIIEIEYENDTYIFN